MKLRIRREAEPSSSRGVYFIQTSEISEASLNVMINVYLEISGVLVRRVSNLVNMQDNIRVYF